MSVKNLKTSLEMFTYLCIQMARLGLTDYHNNGTKSRNFSFEYYSNTVLCLYQKVFEQNPRHKQKNVRTQYSIIVPKYVSRVWLFVCVCLFVLGVCCLLGLFVWLVGLVAPHQPTDRPTDQHTKPTHRTNNATNTWLSICVASFGAGV